MVLCQSRPVLPAREARERFGRPQISPAVDRKPHGFRYAGKDARCGLVAERVNVSISRKSPFLRKIARFGIGMRMAVRICRGIENGRMDFSTMGRNARLLTRAL